MNQEIKSILLNVVLAELGCVILIYSFLHRQARKLKSSEVFLVESKLPSLAIGFAFALIPMLFVFDGLSYLMQSNPDSDNVHKSWQRLSVVHSLIFLPVLCLPNSVFK